MGSQWQAGDNVRVLGLIRRQDLNGRMAELIRQILANQRWEVRIVGSSEQVCIRDDNLNMPSSPAEIRANAAASGGEHMRTNCWGCGKSSEDGQKFDVCSKCAKEKLVPCSFCTKECFAEHWPRHREWHRKQRGLCKQLPAPWVKASTEKLAPAPSPELAELMQQGLVASQALDHNRAAKCYRKVVRLAPEQPEGYYNWAGALTRSADHVGARMQSIHAGYRARERAGKDVRVG
jgi:hypothetical protein